MYIWSDLKVSSNDNTVKKLLDICFFGLMSSVRVALWNIGHTLAISTYASVVNVGVG